MRLSRTALADMNAAAADDYTDDNRHPNPDGFEELFGRLRLDALHPGGARRTRARCRCRSSNPNDYMRT